ncbi:MAG: signal peptidase II [Bacillota bacterium]
MIFVIITGIVLLDQIIKYIIYHSFYPGQSQPVMENVFHLTYVKNTGAAFGIMQGYNYIFIIFSLVVLAFFIYHIVTGRIDSLLFRIASGLLLGGAMGNLLDRIIHGYVIDYLDFRFWPVFNVADVSVVVGVLLMLIFIFQAPGAAGNK